MRNKWIMTFDLVHTIGNRKKRFLSCFYAGQLKTRKTIYGQSSLSTDRVRSRCLFCWTQKAFFYDWFCCRSLEFQKEISRKSSHKNYLKHRFNARQIYDLCALMSNLDFPIKIGVFILDFIRRTHYPTTGSPRSRYEHRRTSALLRNIR